jgi:hypothetical protein
MIAGAERMKCASLNVCDLRSGLTTGLARPFNNRWGGGTRDSFPGGQLKGLAVVTRAATRFYSHTSSTDDQKVINGISLINLFPE